MLIVDVAHNMQGWENYIKWNYWLYWEIEACHRGGLCNDPNKSWGPAQIGFFENYVMQLAERTSKARILREEQSTELIELAQSNLERWKVQGEAVHKIFREGAQNDEREVDVLSKCMNLRMAKIAKKLKN